MSKPAGSSGQRILIVKMWALGDILMATPLLRALKTNDPDCKISWLVDKEYAGALQNNPLIDELIPFDSGTWRRYFRYCNLPAYLSMSLRLRRELNERKFSTVINLAGEKWWSLWFNAAPFKVGLFPNPELSKMGKFYDVAIPRTREPWLHNTRHYLLPADTMDAQRPFDERIVLGVSDTSRQAVQSFLTDSPSFRPGYPILVIHPGTSQATKCWPTEYYSQIVTACLDKYSIVITGSPKESKIAEAILAGASYPDEQGSSQARPIIAAGKLISMADTTALIERANLVVTGDTSVLHISSALDIPFVGIYGSTRPRDNAPLFGRYKLLFDDSVECAPCYKSHCPLHGAAHLACQKGVKPETVLHAMNVLVNDTAVTL